MLVVLWIAGAAFAQDVETELAIFGSNRNAFVFTQEATGGTFTKNEDGTWALSLQGIPAEVEVTEMGVMSARTYETADLVAQWQASIDAAQTAELAELNPYYADATLELDDALASMTIVGAVYDASTETLTYTVQLNAYLPVASVEGQAYDTNFVMVQDKDVAPEFEAASLSISGGNAFLDALKQAILADASGIRLGEVATCESTAANIVLLQAELDAINVQIQTLVAQSKTQEAIALITPRNVTRTNLFYAKTWFRANC
jgi:hypothetical protein